jgi:hypothetical protein
MGKSALLSALLLLSACATAPSADPSSLLQAWTRAVDRNDPHAAYALLSSGTRAQITEAAFTIEWRASAEERRAQAAALRAQTGKHSWRETAQVVSAGRTSPVVRESVGWRIGAPRRTDVGAPTPEDALRRFVQALEERSFDAFLRLLAEPLRGVVERELAERLTALKTAVGKPIAVEGEHARVRYDPRYHIDLRRENGQWQVADFN